MKGRRWRMSTNSDSNICWIHAGPTSGKTTLIKQLRKDGFTVIETDTLFEIIDNNHYVQKVWREDDTTSLTKTIPGYWDWVNKSIVDTVHLLDQTSRANKWLAPDNVRFSTKTIVLSNLWLPVKFFISTFPVQEQIIKRSSDRSEGKNVIPMEIAEKWFTSWLDSDMKKNSTHSFTLEQDQFLSDHIRLIEQEATILLEKQQPLEQKQKQVKEKSNNMKEEKTSIDKHDGISRTMTEEKKQLALGGDAQAQLDWFLEECLEFEAAADNSDEKNNEATDVLGCFVKFNIHVEDALEFLQLHKKDYILAKVIMLLTRVSDRNKLYLALNAKALAKGRKQWNPAELERAFITIKKQINQ